MELERAWSGRAFDSLEDRKFPSSSYAARQVASRATRAKAGRLCEGR